MVGQQVREISYLLEDLSVEDVFLERKDLPLIFTTITFPHQKFFFFSFSLEMKT